MLTNKQQEILTGSLLGDGSIWNNFMPDTWCRWELCQSKLDDRGIDKRGYLSWFAGEFIEIGCTLRTRTVKASGIVKQYSKKTEFTKYVFNTRRLPYWNCIEKHWYVPIEHPHYRRRKIVPQDVRLTPLTLCVWYMDDGTCNPKDANLELCTLGFTSDEVDYLILRLKDDLNINSTIKWTCKNGTKRKPKIYVGRESYFDFIEIVRPHVKWDCFQYKLNTTTYNKQPHRGETHSGSKLTEQQVQQAFDLRKQGFEYKEIADTLNISKTNVSLILSGQRWSHLGFEPLSAVKKPRITDDQRANVRILRQEGLTQRAIAARLNMKQASVSRILKTT